MNSPLIWKQLLLFFFPILLGTFFQQLYNTADAMIVGKYVGKQLSAVATVTQRAVSGQASFAGRAVRKAHSKSRAADQK